jgi:hypothetical protein
MAIDGEALASSILDGIGGQKTPQRVRLFSKMSGAIAEHVAPISRAVDDAQVDVDSALAALADIASDDKLAPAEKGAVLRDAHELIDAQANFDAQADLVGVSRVAYDAAVSGLNTYLLSLGLTLGTNDAAWAAITTDIVGATFRATFATAYNARSTLLNLITAAQKAATDARALTDLTNVIASSVTTALLAPNAVTATQLADAAVTTAKIAGLAVDLSKLADGSVSAAKLLDGAVTAAKILDGIIGTAKLVDGSVIAAKLADLAVSTAKLADGAVTAQKLIDAAVTAQKLGVSLPGDNNVPNSSFTADSNSDGLADGFGIYNNSAGLEPATASLVVGFDGIGFAQRISWSVNNTSQKGIGKTSPNGIPGGWKPNTTYVIAFRARASGTNIGQKMGAGGTGDTLNWNTAPATSVALNNPLLTANPQRYSWRITWGAAVEPTGNLFLSIAGASGTQGTLDFDEVMVTEGDVLQAYSPKVSELVAGAVGTLELAANAVTAAKIAAGTITADRLVAGTITANEIAANAIGTTQLAALAVTAAKITAHTITANEIAALTITAAEIAANAITAAKILAHTITANEIAADTITANEIAANAIGANEIAANAVVAGKIAANAVGTNELAANSIVAGKIAAAAIGADKIAAQAVIAKSLTLTNWDNLWPNPGGEMAPPSGIVPLNDGTSAEFDFRTLDAAGALSGQYVRRIVAGAGGPMNVPVQIPVSPNQQYYFEASMKKAAGAGTAGVVAEWYNSDASGNPNTLLSSSSDLVATSAAYAKRTLSVSAPAGASWAKFILQVAASNTADFDEMYLRRMADANLIVDGSITAQKILAGSIVADKITAGEIDVKKLSGGISFAGNMYPNGGSESAPPLSADLTSPQWVARTADAGAFSGGFVRQLTGTGQQILGDQPVAGGAVAYPPDALTSVIGAIFAAQPDERHYCEARTRYTVAPSSDRAGINFVYLDKDKKTLATSTTTIFVSTTIPLPAPTAWGLASAVSSANAPAGTCFILVYLFDLQNTVGTRTSQFDSIRAFLQTTTPQLQDGCVTPTKLSLVPAEAALRYQSIGTVSPGVTYLAGGSVTINNISVLIYNTSFTSDQTTVDPTLGTITVLTAGVYEIEVEGFFTNTSAAGASPATRFSLLKNNIIQVSSREMTGQGGTVRLPISWKVQLTLAANSVLRLDLDDVSGTWQATVSFDSFSFSVRKIGN